MRKISLLILAVLMMIPVLSYADNGKMESSDSSKSNAPQEKVVRFSSEQTMLNNQAVDAGHAGDFQKAEQLLNAMLQLGEVNIIWMNLGGVYVEEGKCMEAEEAFSHVWTAPQISEVPMEAIKKVMHEKQEKLRMKCSSRVTLSCNPENMKVKIDGGKTFQCSSKEVSLTPGRHSIYAETDYGFNTVVVDVKAHESKTVSVEVIDYERVAVDAGITPEEIEKKSLIFKSVGYSFLGVGVALAAGGGGLLGASYVDYRDALDEYKRNPSKDKFDRTNAKRNDTEKKMNASYGLLVVGGAMTITGIVLVVYDALKYQPKVDEYRKEGKGSDLAFRPSFAPDFAGFSLSGRF